MAKDLKELRSFLFILVKKKFYFALILNLKLLKLMEIIISWNDINFFLNKQNS